MFLIRVYQMVKSIHRSGRRISVGRSVHCIIQQFINAAGSNMQAGIRRSVINVYRAIVIGNPSIAKHHVGNIANSFLTFGCQEISAGFIDYLFRMLQISDKQVLHITQTSSRISNAMGQVQPAQFCFNG